MANRTSPETLKVENIKKKCGVIRPIAAFNNYPQSHWGEIHDIIVEATDKAKYDCTLVSNTFGTNFIHKAIVNNLYNNDIVIADVSGKNPNVMFELGIRLTFDKPTIIIKDDKTEYTFDAGIIDHLEYPADLNYKRINEFKEELAQRIESTQANHTSFLKNFGEFKVSKLEQKDVTEFEYLKQAIENLRSDFTNSLTPNLTNNKSRIRFRSVKYIWERFKEAHGGNEILIDDNSLANFRIFAQIKFPNSYKERGMASMADHKIVSEILS